MWVSGISRRMVETVECVFISSFWERKVSTSLYSNGRAYVKDQKNIAEVQPPGGDHLFVVLRVKSSRDWIPFGLLD